MSTTTGKRGAAAARALHASDAAQNASRPTARKKLLFLQVHKMASRSISEPLVRLKVAKGLVQILPEATTLVPSLRRRGLTRSNAFVIGTVRNPCDWYVSNWKYGCLTEWRGERRKQICGEKRKFTQNVAAFRSYLTSGASIYMSRLMYDDYVGTRGRSYRKSRWICPRGAPRNSTPAAAGCRLDWKRLEPVTFAPTAVDCWVHLTSLDEELQSCLLQWANAAGLDPTAVLRRKAAPRIHEIKALPCSAFYTPELAAAVMQLDRPIFEYFGYTTCCGAPSHW